jgi:hypothetical protein
MAIKLTSAKAETSTVRLLYFTVMPLTGPPPFVRNKKATSFDVASSHTVMVYPFKTARQKIATTKNTAPTQYPFSYYLLLFTG